MLLVKGANQISRWFESGGGYVNEQPLLEAIHSQSYGSLYDVDGDGQQELYLVPDLSSGEVLRTTTAEWTTCNLGPAPYWNRGNYGVVATELNGDGVVDFVSSRTCAGCTSNHILYVGHR